MKNHHFLICILLSLTSLSLFAQEKSKLTEGVEYSISKPYPFIQAGNRHYSRKYYFKVKDYLINVKHGGEKMVLQKFRLGNMSLEKVNHLGFDLKKNHIEKFVVLNERVFVFYSRYIKKTTTEQLFYQEIDVKNCDFDGNEVKVLEVNNKLKGTLIATGLYAFRTLDKFQFEKSYDEKRLLIHYTKKPEKRNNAKSYLEKGLSVFDDKLVKIWSKEVKMPYTEKKMSLIDYTVDKHSNVYLGAKIFLDKDEAREKKKENKTTYNLEILMFNKNLEKNIKIGLDDKRVGGFALYESSKDYIVCAAFYSSTKYFRHADGIVLYKLTKEGELKDEKKYKIPLEVLNRYSSKRAVKKNSKAEKKGEAQFQYLKFTNLQIEDDGSVLLTGEQQYKRTSHSSGNGAQSRTTYYYNDILVTKISGDGKLLWMNKLPKRQVGSQGIGGMSFKFFETSDAYYYMYLDNVKNKGIKNNEVPKIHVDGQGGFLTAYKLDKNTGEFEKLTLLDLRDVRGMKIYQFYPSKIFNVDKNSMMFEVYKKKKQDVLIKIHY